MMQDKIAFYDKATRVVVATAETSMVPLIGSQIAMVGDVWTVTRISFALVVFDDPTQRSFRCNVDVEKEKL